MSVKLYRTIALALVAFMAIGGSVNARGLVLCLEADGGVQVELSVGDDCTDCGVIGEASVRTTGPRFTGDSASADHCGACVDIPLGDAVSKYAVAGRAKGPSMQLQFCAASIASHVSESLAAPRLNSNALTRANSLPSLRSVVLVV
jgi:hypothetical protein